jgi:hypothetical protein
MKIKNILNPSLLAIFAALICAVVFAASVGRGLSPTGVAAASAPLARSVASSLFSPLDLNFSNPVDVSRGNGYNNRALISAAPSNGAVTLAWTNTNISAGSSEIVECSNTSLNGPFSICHGLHGAGANQTEVIGNATDTLGQRHLLYWTYAGGAVCDDHVIIGTDGSVVLDEIIPGSCNAAILHKLGYMAIDNQNNVHIVLARDSTTNSMGYWERTPDGSWPVQNEAISSAGRPTDYSIAVTTNGTVMVAYKAGGIYGAGTDIYTAVRQAPYNWAIDDISADCCQNCPRSSYAYLPKLVGDFQGNIHALWADNRCPGDPSLNTDIYYRKWVPGTGWDNQPMVTVVLNSGISYYPNLTVDPNGVVYATWSDRTSSPVGYYRIFMSYGQGTTFSPVEIPFQDWSGNAWQKESAIAYGAGFVHVNFSSIRDNPQKDNYYSFAPIIGGPIATPTPTGPPCPGQRFTDVCPGTYYYTGVQHLSQAGIIGGYTTAPPCPASSWIPCFLPFNNATRGQMAKLVVLSANIPIDTHGGPHFTDVPTTNTFYQYIETAYNAGIINGYPDHTFRPNANVTRGQLSKMAALAFALHNPPGAQMFEDVLPGSTFYTYVQQLSQLEVISGYACGGAGEPCVPPNNRPYFRPNNDVTRGQTAKILDNLRTIFPPTPTPTPTTQATDTPTATSTSAPVATDTPVGTVTPANTATPGGTVTPGNTETPTSVPTGTPTATQTPAV